MRITRRATEKRCGFTLVELLVVIGIIALLIAILLPVLSKARQAAASAKCLSNVRQIMQAVLMYANDHQGFVPYAGKDDAPGIPAGGDYLANWLYNPSVAPAGYPPGSGVAASGSFTATDVQSGALYEYLNATAVYRCPLDASPLVATSAGKPLFNALTSYCMNSWLSNTCTGSEQLMGVVDYDSDFTGHNHHLHKLTDFHPYNLAFWDFPSAGAINGAGKDLALSKADPATCITSEKPCVSGRHCGHANMITNGFASDVSGGVPSVFIDGHAELWPLYAMQDALNQPGGALGASPIWCSPTSNSGGCVAMPTYDMTGKFSTN